MPEIRLSYLSNTFGNDRSCLNRILADPRKKHIEVQLINQVCVRNKRCGDYEVLAGETLQSLVKKLKNRNPQLIKKIRDAAEKESVALAPFLNNISKLYVSGFLEHDVGPLHKVVIDTIRPFFPTAEMVDNPLRAMQKVQGADIFEQHGETPRIAGRTIINLDGVDAFDIDTGRYIRRYKDSALINFLWIFEFNGNCRAGGAFVDPRKRKCWPTKAQFDALNAAMLARQDAPPPQNCAKVLPARDGEKRGFLWKQSDTHPGAVTLLPQPNKFSRVRVTKGDSVISELRYVYQYTEDGGNRQTWRSGKPALEFPPNVVLRADKICYALDFPQFRLD